MMNDDYVELHVIGLHEHMAYFLASTIKGCYDKPADTKVPSGLEDTDYKMQPKRCCVLIHRGGHDGTFSINVAETAKEVQELIREARSKE